MRTTALWTLLAITCAGGFTRAASQQPMQAPTGVLAGTLTAAADGQPVRKAQLTLTSASPRMTRTTTSDGEGRWLFVDLPAGDYRIVAVGSQGVRQGTELCIDEGDEQLEIHLVWPKRDRGVSA